MRDRTRSIKGFRGARQHPEPQDVLRGPFELDCHRIMSCTAFRRLQHKTQVFAPAIHDHFRNRLTHSLEVARIARCLARNLCVDQDLSEAIALAHDLGHPPFSHAGEKALDELMTGEGGFNHNAHSLRVVEYLEHPYPAFRGLNLTLATLSGLRAHATQFDVPTESFCAVEPLESQIVSWADRMAYDLHDLEDALGAGLIGDEDLSRLRIWAAASDQLAEGRPIHAIRRQVLDKMLFDLLSDVIKGDEANSSNVIQHSRTLGLSSVHESALRDLENLLLTKVYKNPEVARADSEGRRIIHELFTAYTREPELMPDRFADRIPDQGIRRVICDYVAGMTDHYCVAEHRKIC